MHWKETEGWKLRKDTKFNYIMTMQLAKLFADWLQPRMLTSLSSRIKYGCSISLINKHFQFLPPRAMAKHPRNP